MSLNSDIRQSNVSVSGTLEDGIRAEFNFSGNLELFKGHFPGRPILPGIVQIEMVKLSIEAILGKKLSLHSVTHVKFSRLIEPDTPVSVDIDITLCAADADQHPLIEARAQVCVKGTSAGKLNFVLAVADQ